MNAKELKQEARQNLKGKWQKAVVISILYSAILFVVAILAQQISTIFNVVNVVIGPALTYGIAYSYYHLKKGDEVGYADFLTIGFKNFGRSWKIAWEIIKKTWWCILLMIIPLVIIISLVGGAIITSIGSGALSTKTYKSGYTYKSSPYTSYKYDYNYDNYLDNYYSGASNKYNNEEVEKILSNISVGMVAGIGIAFIVYIVVAIFVAIKFLLYVLVYYITVIKEDIDPKDAVIESETLMKGNRGRYFGLMLSFFGWYFLVGFVTGMVEFTGISILATAVSSIGAAILSPYVAFTLIAFYENLSKEKNINAQNQESISDKA